MWKSGKRWLFSATCLVTLACVGLTTVPNGLAPTVTVRADANGVNDLTVNTSEIMSDEVSEAMRSSLSGESYTGIVKDLKWHNGEVVDGISLTTVAENASNMGTLFPGNGNLASADNIFSTDAAYDIAGGTSGSFVISDVGLYVGNDGTKRPVNMRVIPLSFNSTSNLPHEVIYAVKNNNGTITIAAMSRFAGSLTGSGGEGGSSSGGGSGAIGYGRLGMRGFSYRVLLEFDDGTTIPETTAFGVKFSEIDAAQSVAIDTNGLEGLIRRSDSALTKVNNGLANTDPAATTEDSGSLSRTAFLAIYKANQMVVDYSSNLTTSPLDIVTSLFGNAPDVPEAPAPVVEEPEPEIPDMPSAPEGPKSPTAPTFEELPLDIEPIAPTPPKVPSLEEYQAFPSYKALKQKSRPVKDVLDGATKRSIAGDKTLTDVTWLWEVAQRLDAKDTAYSDFQDYVAEVTAIAAENEAIQARNEAKKAKYDSDYATYEADYEDYSLAVKTYNARIAKNQAAWSTYETAWSRYVTDFKDYQDAYANYEEKYDQYQAAWQEYLAAGGSGTIVEKAAKRNRGDKVAEPSQRYLSTITAVSKASSQTKSLVIKALPTVPNTKQSDFLFDQFVLTDVFDTEKVNLSEATQIYVLDDAGKELDSGYYTSSINKGTVTVKFKPSYLNSDAFYGRGNTGDGYKIYIPSMTNIDDQAEGQATKIVDNTATVSVEPGEDQPTNEVSVSPDYTEPAIRKAVLQYTDNPSFGDLLKEKDWRTREELVLTESRYAYKVQYDLGNHADYASMTLSDPWFADIQVAPDEIAIYATVNSSKGQEKSRVLLKEQTDYTVTYGDAVGLQKDGKLANTMGFKIVLKNVGQYARKTTRFEVLLKGVSLQGLSGQESYLYLNHVDADGPNGPQHDTLTDNLMHIYNTAQLDFSDQTPDDDKDRGYGKLISNTTEVVPPVVEAKTQKYVESDALSQPEMEEASDEIEK